MQKHDTSITSPTVIAKSVTQDVTKEATRPENLAKVNLRDENHLIASTSNSESPSNVSKTNRRRPRKSRVIANWDIKLDS